MSYEGDVFVEVDRLVVAVHSKGGEMFAEHELGRSLTAHPGLVNGMGALLTRGPVDVGAVEVIYPYLDDRLREALIQNNVEEGVVALDNGQLRATDAGTPLARAAGELLDEAADAFWEGQSLDDAETLGGRMVEHGRGLEPPITPSAFAYTQALVDRPTQPARVYRLIEAMRYWRADAHRAAWSAHGLDARGAHALNRLWIADIGVDRPGQGFEAPGRRGTAALEERGWAADGAITDSGRKQRLLIEQSTDERTAPIFDALDDTGRASFLAALSALRI